MRNEYNDEPIVNARQFEKVAYDQFVRDMKDEFPYFAGNEHDDELEKMYEDIKLPTRSTQRAAGFDFYSPFKFTLKPGTQLKIPTGIRVDMDKNAWLLLCPKGGLGFKTSVKLANTIGVDDADYYYAGNEGHIFIKLEMPVLCTQENQLAKSLSGSSKSNLPMQVDVMNIAYDDYICFGKSTVIPEQKDLNVEAGEKFAQGIFMPYGVTDNDAHTSKKDRTGGFGSSGRF